MPPESTAPTGQALPAGTRLEEFEVEKVLGTGGFGITYLARDTSLGRQVVIKENLPAMFASRDTASGTVRPRSDLHEDTENFSWSMENFLREADTLAALDHPGIVSVLRKFEANGTAYFVMPHVEGLALDAMQKRRREKGQSFGDDELKGLLEHVLDALGYLHARGIYHRDIKPGNILVTKEGVPILIDFGSARQRLSERSMTVIESAGYTPFEQLESRGNVGPWSDLYSLGATVVKMITGEAPPKAMDRMRNDPYEPLYLDLELRDRYSKALLDSIDRSLQVDEASRFQDAVEWLGSLLEGQLSSGGEKAESLESEEGSEASSEEDPGNLRGKGKGKGLLVAASQNDLGYMYGNGCGVAHDEEEAVKWYRKAAEQDYAKAQYNLGVMYASGRGVAKDEEEAVKWYRKAAEQEYASAQYALGLRYASGRGVARSEEEAVKWFRRAAALGNENANSALSRRGIRE